MALQKLFCNPPLVIARLGRSQQPVDAYKWVHDSDPHRTGVTQVVPTWTLDVQTDATVKPRMPCDIRFRDIQGIRPVAPFVEIWCLLAGDPTPQPLTEEILKSEGLSLTDLSFRFDAKNRKAARRTGNDDLVYGTFPPEVVSGDDFNPRSIDAHSPSNVDLEKRMIPDGRSVNFGSFQVIRPTDPKAPRSPEWPESLNLNTIRVRFTPARGNFYGPEGHNTPSIPLENAILKGEAGWLGAKVERDTTTGQPYNTYAGAEPERNGLSYGIVDDTCDIKLEVDLTTGVNRDRVLSASANIFSGPADFSPDSRPFVSLADALLDREGDNTARNAAMNSAEKDAWIEDLFERVYEHVSLMNVDYQRNKVIFRSGDEASKLSEAHRRESPIPHDQTSRPEHAMGGFDALRDEAIPLPAASPQNPLPLTERARERHRFLSGLHTLKNFVEREPGRMTQLVRKPFQENEDGFTMKMPPFMRGSNGEALTLSVAQYDLLMSWVNEVIEEGEQTPPSLLAAAAGVNETAANEISARASARRAIILAKDNLEM